MTITEIIQHVGDENIQVQNLAQNLTAANCGKKDAKLTFATSPENGQAMAREAAGIQSDTVALILWMPKSKLPNAQKEAR